MAQQQTKQVSRTFWVVLGVVVLLMVVFLTPGKNDGGGASTDTSDPCELPSTYEVESDFTKAPADQYYDRCYKSIADQFNE